MAASDSINNDRTDVFAYIAGCGSTVKLSTGYTYNNMVHTDYVVVHDAPPRVVSEIVTKFKLVSLREGVGLVIPLDSKSGDTHV